MESAWLREITKMELGGDMASARMRSLIFISMPMTFLTPPFIIDSYGHLPVSGHSNQSESE